MSLLPFDETGTASTNLVTEDHTVSSINSDQYFYIVPDYAPFFGNGFALYHKESEDFLTEGVDFELTHDFEEAFENLAENVYGSITILDTSLTGTFQVQYQSLGGDYATTDNAAIENGFDTLANLQSYTWEDIADIPDTFPTTYHTHSSEDIEGVTEILAEMVLIREAIENGAMDISVDDISDLDSTLITPLLTAFDDIKTAIAAKNYTNTLYQEQSLISEETKQVTTSADTWADTSLTVTLSESGTFQVSWDGDFSSKNGNTVYTRFTVEDAAVSRSYNNGALIALAEEYVLRLQVMVEDEDDVVTVAKPYKGAHLTALSVGN